MVLNASQEINKICKNAKQANVLQLSLGFLKRK